MTHANDQEINFLISNGGKLGIQIDELRRYSLANFRFFVDF